MLFRYFYGFGTTPLVPTTRFFHVILDGEDVELWDCFLMDFDVFNSFFVMNTVIEFSPPPVRTRAGGGCKLTAAQVGNP